MDVADEFGATPLLCAARRGATISSLYLAKRGASLQSRDHVGNDALGIALATWPLLGSPRSLVKSQAQAPFATGGLFGDADEMRHSCSFFGSDEKKNSKHGRHAVPCGFFRRQSAEASGHDQYGITLLSQGAGDVERPMRPDLGTEQEPLVASLLLTNWAFHSKNLSDRNRAETLRLSCWQQCRGPFVVKEQSKHLVASSH